MRSLIQSKSLNSVKVFWLNRELLNQRINEAVARIGVERPEVAKVFLFGSAAEDRAVPGSDADVLMLVRNEPGRFIDRGSVYQPYFRDIGLGVDVFVYTIDELNTRKPPIAMAALSKGKLLFQRGD
jgi:predicted nucleotidyltransferase